MNNTMFPIEITSGTVQHPLLLATCALVVLAILAGRRLFNARLVAATPAPGLTSHFEDSFVHHLARRGLSPRIARSTYRHLQQKRRSPIRPDDALRQDLGLDRASILATARALLHLNGRQIGSNYLFADLTTVSDLVRLVQTAERQELDRAA